MPEAIATTKRKFYRALDALSAPSNASSTTSTSSITSPSSSKRSSTVAFDEARERVRKRLRQSTSTESLNANRNTSIISVSGRSTSNLPSSTSPPKAPPNFSPWSQETFLARLKTFSKVSQWHPKPDSINEVQWAKRGWSCVDVNTVACKGGCGRRVLVSVDVPRQRETQDEDNTEEEQDQEEDDESMFEDALAQRYSVQIVEGHSPTCLWRGEGCKDDIYRLPVVRTSIWQPQLRQRLHSLLAILPSIEHVKTRTLESFDKNVFDNLPRDVLALPDPPVAGSGKAFELAMHGWRGSSEAGNNLLHCDACFQRIGLWMYQPDYKRPRSGPQDDGDVEEEGPSVLDLTELHRDHCPWRNSETQKATGSLDGLNACQVLQRVVATAARDHRRRSANQEVNEAEEQAASDAAMPVHLSREETARADKERESKLRKLRNLLSVRRRPTTKVQPLPQKTV